MYIQIQSTPFALSSIFTDKIKHKLSALRKFYERIELCNVILKKEKSTHKQEFTVEVRLAVPNADLFATETAESYGRALSLVIANLKKQLIKHKQKLNEIPIMIENVQ